MILSVPRAIWLEFEKHQQQEQIRSKSNNRIANSTPAAADSPKIIFNPTPSLPTPLPTPKYPPVQLPIRIYLKNEFEAIIYDMDQPTGEKYVNVPDARDPKRIRRPRSRMFVRIVKVPKHRDYAPLQDKLFSNLSQAVSGCEFGSTASGWVAWNIKYKEMNGATRMVNIGHFRKMMEEDCADGSDQQGVPQGSGFILSPHICSVYRDVLALHASPKNNDFGFQHTKKDLESFGVKKLSEISLKDVYSAL